MGNAVRVIQPVERQRQKTKVCAYIRVSTDSDDQLNSFANQGSAFLEYIQSNPEWEFVDIYADEGITGTRADKRDELQRMLKDCKAGKIDRILTKSVSRFARNAVECLEMVRDLKEHNVSITFEKENIDTANMASEMILAIRSAFAEQESRSISQNLRWAFQKRVEAKDFITFYAPYGYRLENGELKIIDGERKIVEQIFTWFLNGKSQRQIADLLNEKKTPHRKCKPWSREIIISILSNEKYIGDCLIGKTYKSESLPFRQKRNKGNRKKYYMPETQEAIISKEVFGKAQKLIDQKRIGRGYSIKPYTFTSKMKCSCCGSVFYRRKQKDLAVWACCSHINDKDTCPVKPVYERELISAFVVMINRLIMCNGTALLDYLSNVERLQNMELLSQPDTLKINKKIAELMKQNHALNRLRSAGSIDSAFYMSQSNDLNQQVTELKKELRKYQNDNLQNIIKDSKSLIREIEDREYLREFDENLFKMSVAEIQINETGMEFHLKNGLKFRESRDFP